MRACSSDVSVFLALVLAAFFVAAAAAPTSHGGVFYVGDQDGWVGKPAESYGRWATRHRFKVTDTLVFEYKKGADSVLVVDKRHYDACDVRDPISKRSDGDSAYVLGTAGAFYFISGDAGRCRQGQKLMVVVAAETAEPPAGSQQAPSPSPALVPSTSGPGPEVHDAGQSGPEVAAI
ncbi:early nodulin-like protein 2 [Panicum virgatum]|uniref:early nodulin-like protein 2 n=1 Tax=Panicum virgatum TaxID=38727 RepID=UPI0019D53CC9|nr:early nodulin-like protein 2 [Panicum virgatum]